MFAIMPILIFIVYIALMIYIILLIGRFVIAMEKIADRIGQIANKFDQK